MFKWIGSNVFFGWSLGRGIWFGVILTAKTIETGIILSIVDIKRAFMSFEKRFLIKQQQRSNIENMKVRLAYYDPKKYILKQKLTFFSLVC